MSERILPKDDPVLLEHYGDFVRLFPDAVFVAVDGVYRFQKKKLACWLGDHVSLNDMIAAYQRGAFPLEEYMQFYQDIGYSLCGFADISAFGDFLRGKQP